MAGHHRLPPHAATLHYQQQPPPHAILSRGAQPPPPPSIIAALEDRIALQHRDLQQLLADNQRLAASHVALKQDLAASLHDCRLLSDSAAQSQSESDAAVREFYDRSLRAEAEARKVEGMRAELAAVRSDVGKLAEDRDEFIQKAEKLRAEVAKAKGEMGKVEEAMQEIEHIRREIERGRAAVEYEKKAHAENLEHSQVMEKNMISMAREVEKLRAELANAEKRARAAAAAAAAKPGPAYAESYGKNEMAYGGSTYANPYGLHQVGTSRDLKESGTAQIFISNAQRGADGGSQYGAQYGSGAAPRGPYDIQQTHAHI